MIKVVDMAWIADKSLDIYCSTIPHKTVIDNRPVKYRSKSVSSRVGKIFSDVFDASIAEYSKKYEKVFYIVPCFPMMRMGHASIISRFICRNGEFLSELGVSSVQFQDFFEKFISEKCKNEYVTKIGENCYLLNGRGILLHDWLESITNCYGSSLIDYSSDGIFLNRPSFLNTMEDNMDIFSETTEEIKYKTKEIILGLT